MEQKKLGTKVLELIESTYLVFFQLVEASFNKNGFNNIETNDLNMKSSYYSSSIPGIKIQRLNFYLLGQDLLGEIDTYTNVIKILDNLYGLSYLEVLVHELEHKKDPTAPEYEIRDKTFKKLGYNLN